MEHHLRKIRTKKQFFIKCFLVSIVVMIIVSIVSAFGYNFFSSIAERYYNIDQEEYGQIVVMSCAIWKLLILQFTLVPAIAMAIIERRVKADEVIE